MFSSSHLLVAALVVFSGALASGVAQAPPRKTALTTTSGVYTASQAARGEQTYMNICVACHPPGTYTAPAFRDKWNRLPLSQLFGYVSSMMPKLEPGSLSPQEYADVTAYLLKINGAPAGKSQLPPNEAALKKIRIEMPVARSKTTK